MADQLRSHTLSRSRRVLKSEYAALRQRMSDTGIGYAGLDGAWWLPACEPFRLPAYLADELADCGRAIFALIDAVTRLYHDDAPAAVRRLLGHKVPAHVRRQTDRSPALSLRPDFQLQPLPDGRIRPVVTELEICPSAHGFAHAMQVGYQLETDIVQAFARLLGGRTLLIVGTYHWSEFIFDQLAFCRALAEAGARAFVLTDRPVSQMAADVRRGKRWQLPMFGVHERPAEWNIDVASRLRQTDLERFLWPDAGEWPEDVGDAMVFRFGYVDLFDEEVLGSFGLWQAAGATMLNPASFILDTKVTMAALALADVRDRIEFDSPGCLAILDRCIPETILVDDQHVPELVREKDAWIVKYAGFDGDNQAWGGRSLQAGAGLMDDAWADVLTRALQRPWPVVAQRFVPSLAVDIDYLDHANQPVRLHDVGTRLRTFFLRHGDEVSSCGAHITCGPGRNRVSEGTDAVQAPVQFET